MEESVSMAIFNARSMLASIPWNQRSVLWIGISGAEAREALDRFVRMMAQAGYCKEWSFMDEDGSTRRFLEERAADAWYAYFPSLDLSYGSRKQTLNFLSPFHRFQTPRSPRSGSTRSMFCTLFFRSCFFDLHPTQL